MENAGKVCFIIPPSPFLINEKVFSSLGVYYLMSVLDREGFKTDLYDCSGKPEEQWSEDVKKIDADYYCITSTTPQYEYAEKIAAVIKSINKDRKIIIGGVHVSSGGDYSKDLFDIAVIGDGEPILPKILKPDFGAGYVFGEVDDIDTIPFPKREAVSKDYKYYIDGRLSTHMITSRGCPYSCAFCCQWNKTRKIRLHSAEYVIDEIDEVKKLGYKGIMFFDDIFIINKTRLFKITKHLKKNGIIYRCFVRADIATEEIIKNLAVTGCKEIGFGSESGSQKILDIIDKKTTVEQNRNLIRLCKKHGIRVKTFFIIGLPGETSATLKETEEFIEETKPDDIDFTILSVFKGSDIAKNPDKYDIKFDEYGAFYKGTPGKYECHVSTFSLSSKRILEARNHLENKFKKKERLI